MSETVKQCRAILLLNDIKLFIRVRILPEDPYLNMPVYAKYKTKDSRSCDELKNKQKSRF